MRRLITKAFKGGDCFLMVKLLGFNATKPPINQNLTLNQELSAFSIRNGHDPIYALPMKYRKAL